MYYFRKASLFCQVDSFDYKQSEKEKLLLNLINKNRKRKFVNKIAI